MGRRRICAPSPNIARARCSSVPRRCAIVRPLSTASPSTWLNTGVCVASSSSVRNDARRPARPSALVDAVEATLRGDAVFTPELAGLVLAHLRGLVDTANDSASALTPRESEVLRMVAKGLASKQIASRLGLSSRTVDNHVAAHGRISGQRRGATRTPARWGARPVMYAECCIDVHTHQKGEM